MMAMQFFYGSGGVNSETHQAEGVNDGGVHFPLHLITGYRCGEKWGSKYYLNILLLVLLLLVFSIR